MKILLAQCNFIIGDFAGNVAQILAIYQRYASEVDLIAFTELALSGYYPMDLLTQPNFLSEHDAALLQLQRATVGQRAALLSGFIDKNRSSGKPLHNALAIFQDGARVFHYHKKLLPTYNIFDEARHFEPGEIPGLFNFGGIRFGFAICEDLWNDELDHDYDDVPIAALQEAGAQLIFSINASPSNIAKNAERLARFSASAKRHGLGILYVNQVGGNDEIVFDGNSFYVDQNGSVRFQMKAFAPDIGIVELDAQGNFVSVLTTAAAPEVMQDTSKPAFFYQQILLGLQDYCRKCGFSKVLVGSSGGIDSALTIALAAAALGPENVLAVTMPSEYSSAGSVADSVLLCANVGVKLRHASIRSQFALAIASFTDVHGIVPNSLTQQNIQARLRGRMLMEISNHFGHLLLSTGNKSEMSVGYATLYGDMNGGLNLIGDLYKMDVYALSRWLNQQAGKELIPQAIIDKEPSAELAPGQKDSDALPPYPVLDAILRLAIEAGAMPDAEVRALREFLHPVALDEVQRVLTLLARAEFKRWQAPPIIRCQRRAFGIGWRMPVAQKFVLDAGILLGRND
jgi:NAD+ synthetase